MGARLNRKEREEEIKVGNEDVCGEQLCGIFSFPLSLQMMAEYGLRNDYLEGREIPGMIN